MEYHAHSEGYVVKVKAVGNKKGFPLLPLFFLQTSTERGTGSNSCYATSRAGGGRGRRVVRVNFDHSLFPQREMLRCFRPKPLPSSPPPPKNNASPSSQQQQQEEEEEEEEEAETASASTSEISKGEQTPRSSAASGSGSASRTPPTLNLSREYIDAVQTRSYDDVWTKIHRSSHQLISSSSSNLVSEILEPNQESINAVLREATPNKLTRLVSEYFTNSEQTSHLCLLLHRSIERARTIYSPLHLLLQHLPSSSSSSQSESQIQFSQSQCDWAVENFRAFMSVENPFPHPDSDNFRDMRCCFSQLRAQLDRRLRKARKKQKLIRRSGKGSALCLIGATVGLAVSALIVATHALVALAAPIFTSLLPMGFAKKQLDSLRLLRRHIEQLDAAARGTYVLNNDLDTVDRLVARLHATVESDKLLIQLGLERGGDRYSIQEVVKQLRKNSSNLEQQLKDLEEHVCLCFVTVNRARSILLREMFLHQHLSSS